MSMTAELLGSSDDRLPRWHVFLAILLIAASLVPIWIAPRFPSQNGPWYLLIVHMFKELGSPQWNYADFYQVNWNPVPHSLHELLMLGLYTFVPLLTAEKLALSVYAVALPLSVFYFLHVVAPRWTFMGYLSFLAIHNFPFYRGYQDFCLSIPLFFIAFTFWYRHRDRPRVRHWILLAVLSGAIYLAHLITFAMLAGIIGYYRLLETKNVRKALTSSLAVTWLGWILVVDYVLLIKAHPGGFTVEDTSFVPLHIALENIPRNMFFTISPLAYAVVVLPWLWLAYFLGRRLWRAIRNRDGFRELTSDPLFVVTASLSLTYFAVPEKLAGWHQVNIRLIPFMLLMGLGCGGALIPAASARKFRVALISSVAIAAAVVYSLLAVEVVRINRDIDEYLSGIPYFKPNSRLLSVHLENDLYGQVRPVTRAHEHYHIAKGGANGLSVARYNHLTLLWYREPPTTTFPRFHAYETREYLRRMTDSYEHVLVWGGPDGWPERLSSLGFRLVHSEGRLRLFENEKLIDPTDTTSTESAAGSREAGRANRQLDGARP